MTAIEKERLGIVETKVDNLTDRLNSIEKKLDAVLETKADQKEVDSIQKRQWAIITAIAGGAVLSILGLFYFLVELHIK